MAKEVTALFTVGRTVPALSMRDDDWGMALRSGITDNQIPGPARHGARIRLWLVEALKPESTAKLRETHSRGALLKPVRGTCPVHSDSESGALEEAL